MKVDINERVPWGKKDASLPALKRLPSNWKAGFNSRYQPACGGKETPSYKGGKWWLLIWDTEEHKHLKYCYDEDIFYPV